MLGEQGPKPWKREDMEERDEGNGWRGWVNTSPLIRSPIPLSRQRKWWLCTSLLLILLHQQHLISDYGVCLWLMLKNRRNNESEKRWRNTQVGMSKGEKWVLTDQSAGISTWLNLSVCREKQRMAMDWQDWAHISSALFVVPFCPSVSPGPHPSLSLSSPSREAGSPDPMWKLATCIPWQSTLLWENQALLHLRQRDREKERER